MLPLIELLQETHTIITTFFYSYWWAAL